MKRIGKGVAVVLLMVGLLPAAVSAGSSLLDERIDIELRDADLIQTLRSFGAILQPKEVRIDPTVSGTVTIKLHDVRVETALNAICEGAGCLWRLEDGVLAVEPDPDYVPRPRPESLEGEAADPLSQPISLRLEDADIREVLQMLAELVQMRLEIDPEIAGEVTIEVEEAPAHRVLGQLCEMRSCTWGLSVEDGATVLKVRPR